MISLNRGEATGTNTRTFNVIKEHDHGMREEKSQKKEERKEERTHIRNEKGH
jgi:hypothetical protein